MCEGHYENKPPLHKKFIKKKQCIPTNGNEMDSCIYTKLLNFEVINASNIYTKYKS
jgi:hypothetical protein